jgi:glycosyltransferase involved in cell wall biosynthesis
VKPPTVRVVCATSHSGGLDPALRYRWEQWQPLLAAEGIAVDFLPFCSPDLDRRLREHRYGRAIAAGLARYPVWFRDFVRARNADVLVIPRKAIPVGQPFVELAVANSGVPFVYDFDDAIYLDPPGRASPLRKLARARWRCGALCRAATGVIVGNDVLARFARRHNTAVTVVPTTVDTDLHLPRTALKRPGTPLVVGWMGSPSTSRYVQQLLPVLREAQRQCPFELLIVGATFDLTGVSGRCLPWSADTEVALLQEMDIGLMPLDDGPWERGKCALKALLYQAVGVPAVVSDVGVNSTAVKNGETGMVVSSDAQWIQSILLLARDPELRRSLGAQGRQHVVREYSARRWAPVVAERLLAAYETARRRS